MRGKLLGKGSAALTELEILEMLLYTGAKRGDTKPLPKQLIKTFKSLSAVIVIALLDNLIVAGASCVSFKSLDHLKSSGFVAVKRGLAIVQYFFGSFSG